MSEFRDIIASSLPNLLATSNPLLGDAIRCDLADAVLAMPEMRVLAYLASYGLGHYLPTIDRATQDVVQEWVRLALGGDA